MSFLQPWLLLALPLVLVPIIIHLVNQWRYQTKPWAAMMFLLAAKSMHRGLAKLRQWLILAMRVLAIAGLILAISRPLTSGIVGLVTGGRIDTTIVMLDRSPSMLQQSPSSRESKLATGLRQLRQTLSTQSSARWILIDSAVPTSQEFESLDALIDSPVSLGTSAIGIWPAMFQSALDYIHINRPSQTNIWICSDMRQGDWQADRGPWPAIREAFQKLSSPVRFFVLTYPEIASSNYALSVEQVRLVGDADHYEVVMTIRVRRNTPNQGTETVPVQIAIGSGHSQVDVDVIQGLGELKDHRIPIDSSTTLGWGKAWIPSDVNPADNEQFFVFNVAPVQQTIIVVEQPELTLPFQIACEIPKDASGTPDVSVVTFDKVSQVNFDDASLVIWQGALPTSEIADQLSDHLNRGRSVWFLPSMALLEDRSQGNSDTTFGGFRWRDNRMLESPIKPTTWRSDEGLLASTQSGMALPVGEILVSRYATIEGETMALATLEGGAPLLAKLNIERGHAYVCTTLPVDRASTMATNGISLFVAIQRSIEQGGIALGNAIAYTAIPKLRGANDRQPKDGSRSESSVATPTTSELNLTAVETWHPIAVDDRFVSNELGLHSGVFESGAKLVAVNRSPAEDNPESLSETQFAQLLHGLNYVRIEDSAGSNKSIQQEIWRAFLLLMILALLLEALISLPRKQLAK
ncbi:MAG: BatA domain-containing protein [Pirellulaceae bacterium]|nr:BatA domain-containing protein [Pirellulaceae bacterium]